MSGHGRNTLAGDVGAVVQEVIQEPEPEVGHADLVGVREREREAHARMGQSFTMLPNSPPT